LFLLFAAGVVDTGGNMPPVSTTQGNWWQNVPPVLLIPVANLPPVSLIPAATCHRCQATGVVDTGGAPLLANISANLQKNLK
jgi:hypothetical protein